MCVCERLAFLSTSLFLYCSIFSSISSVLPFSYFLSLLAFPSFCIIFCFYIELSFSNFLYSFHFLIFFLLLFFFYFLEHVLFSDVTNKVKRTYTCREEKTGRISDNPQCMFIGFFWKHNSTNAQTIDAPHRTRH